MPFPWKKNRGRVTRFSQIVADLQSPKRGGSLVVETGFPTSLIDLFVKNRSRFQKSKSKKPLQPEISDPPPPPPSPATTPAPLPDPPRPIFPLAEAPRLNQFVSENADAVEVSDRVGEPENGSGSNLVVGVFVKVFVVFILIANVNRLTVGITVSAFSLVFLEYAGKRFVSKRFAPCSNANVAMQYLSKRFSSCVWFQKLLLQLKVKKSNLEEPSFQLRSGSSSIDEIEVVESNSEVGIRCEESFFVDGHELDWDDSSIGITKVVESCGISECKTRGSRSGRFKSHMMKKLVPKKIRDSKKEKKEKRSKEIEDKSHSFEIEEEEENNSIRSSLLLRTKLEESVRDDDDDDGLEGDYGITCSQEPLLAKEVVVAVTLSDEKRIDRVGNSGYIILLVIALAGLVVGRFPALILTMTWCFILKIVKTLWRSQNVPLIKCSVPNS